MQKKTVHLILISIASLVWIIVLYKFIFNESDENNSDKESLAISKTDKIVDTIKREKKITGYPDSLLNDPFITPFNHKSPRKKVIKKKIEKKEIEIIPELKLLGTLKDREGGPMAIIQLPDHTTLIVREKQKINDYVIEKINNKILNYRYKDKSLEIQLQ